MRLASKVTGCRVKRDSLEQRLAGVVGRVLAVALTVIWGETAQRSGPAADNREVVDAVGPGPWDAVEERGRLNSTRQ